MCTPGAKNLGGHLRILLSHHRKLNEYLESTHTVENYAAVIKGKKGLGELLWSDFQDTLYIVM